MDVHDLVVVLGVGLPVVVSLVVAAWRIGSLIARLQNDVDTIRREVEVNSGESLKDRVMRAEILLQQIVDGGAVGPPR